MSLKDAEKRLEQTATCKVVAFVESLDKDDLATFAAWVAGKKPAGWIARVIAADGKLINEKTLKRHLDGNCQCPATMLHKGAYRVAK
jgi:hypothetical protein